MITGIVSRLKGAFRHLVSGVSEYFQRSRRNKYAPPVSRESAESLSAYQAAHKVIADAFSALPLCVFERTSRGDERRHDQPQARLVADPHPDSTWPTLIDALIRSLLYGEAFLRIVPGPRRKYLKLLPRGAVTVGRITGGRRSGELAYRIDLEGKTEYLPREEVIHIPWMSVDGATGISALLLHYAVVELGLSIEDFCRQFFLRGHQGGYIEWGEKHASLSPERKDEIAQLFSRSIGPSSEEKVAHLEEGAVFKTLDNSKPEDAQLLATRRFHIEEIARIFNIPVYMLKVVQGQTHTNAHESVRAFVRDTLMPIAARIEAELNRKLFTGRERGRFYFRFDFTELLRADDLTLARVHAIYRQNGIYSRNDARRELRLPLISADEGGDSYAPSLAPTNMFGQGPEGELKGAPGKQERHQDLGSVDALLLSPVFGASLRSIRARVDGARKAEGGRLDPRQAPKLLEYCCRTLSPGMQALALHQEGPLDAGALRSVGRQVLQAVASGALLSGEEVALLAYHSLKGEGGGDLESAQQHPM